MKVNTEININNIAAKLAQCDDIEQAKFFDVFFGELARHCETHYRKEMQLHAIADKLRDSSIECIKVLGFEEND